ncbi:pentapeptide repeat-containing protein [Actinomyces sp. ZJ308]|uniref:pentapeptide repeat-containing protein n=1 Tax=Actinomyces sp. ZJ308 TaxID=2708342 RepID=UPI00141E721F|nr:pentapeptide repeat-containing protein [Actinomyces sp. ZJ308]
MADVADTYGSEKYGVDYNKRVVEILCGYLRTNRSIPTRLDHAIESTIWNAISNRTERVPRKGTSQWSYLDLDLHRTTLVEDISLNLARISSINLQETTLVSTCSFTGLSIEEKAGFKEATFFKAANFYNAYFGRAEFDNAHFKSTVNFSNSEFKNISALEHRFKFIHFEKDVAFCGTKFYGDTKFTGSIFEKQVSFSCPLCSPGECKSSSYQHTGAHFVGAADFSGVTFKEGVNFRGSLFNVNLKDEDKISFPQDLELNKEGLPEGAKWVEFNEDGNPLLLNQ